MGLHPVLSAWLVRWHPRPHEDTLPPLLSSLEEELTFCRRRCFVPSGWMPRFLRPMGDDMTIGTTQSESYVSRKSELLVSKSQWKSEHGDGMRKGANAHLSSAEERHAVKNRAIL